MRKQTAGEREKPDSALAFAGRIMYNLVYESAYRSGKLFSIDCPSGLSLRTSDRCHWCGNPFSLSIQNQEKLLQDHIVANLPNGSSHIWREPEAGTFASAAGGGRSEQKGVAAVEILRASASRRFRAPQQDITGGLEKRNKFILLLISQSGVHISGGNPKRGRLRAPPVAEEASKKEWQRSKSCEPQRAEDFGHRNRT